MVGIAIQHRPASVVTAAVVGFGLMAVGGFISFQLVNRLAPSPWMAASQSFAPTHWAPAGGLPVTDAPDPTRPVMGTIPEFQPLMIQNVAGDWAQVRAINGWSGWVNGRMLVTSNPVTGGVSWR